MKFMPSRRTWTFTAILAILAIYFFALRRALTSAIASQVEAIALAACIDEHLKHSRDDD